MRIPDLPDIPDWGWRLAGCLCFLGLWQALAAWGGGLAVAAPLETLRTLAGLLGQGGFWLTGLLPTLGRVLAGFGLGVAVGGALGGWAGLHRGACLFLLPLRWVLSSVPGVVLVILAMLWWGVGSAMVVAIVALSVVPTIFLAVREGFAAVDDGLREMARAYGLGWGRRLTALYLPAASAPFLSGCVVALGGGMRVAILGETLGASQGLGYALALARANLDTPKLYAVALVSMLLVSLVEATLLRCLRRTLRRGRTP
jgi:NitT/TauT family transport system permease protein